MPRANSSKSTAAVGIKAVTLFYKEAYAVSCPKAFDESRAKVLALIASEVKTAGLTPEVVREDMIATARAQLDGVLASHKNTKGHLRVTPLELCVWTMGVAMLTVCRDGDAMFAETVIVL